MNTKTLNLDNMSSQADYTISQEEGFDKEGNWVLFQVKTWWRGKSAGEKVYTILRILKAAAWKF